MILTLLWLLFYFTVYICYSYSSFSTTWEERVIWLVGVQRPTEGKISKSRLEGNVGCLVTSSLHVEQEEAFIQKKSKLQSDWLTKLTNIKTSFKTWIKVVDVNSLQISNTWNHPRNPTFSFRPFYLSQLRCVRLAGKRTRTWGVALSPCRSSQLWVPCSDQVVLNISQTNAVLLNYLEPLHQRGRAGGGVVLWDGVSTF